MIDSGIKHCLFIRAAAGLSIFLTIVAVVLFVDLPSSDNQSHIGKSLGMIEANGGTAVSDIIVRKISMNYRGIASIRGYALALMAGLAYLLGRARKTARGPFSLIRPEYPMTVKGFHALIWTGALIVAVNDTGAVAALSISIYLLLPLFFLVLASPRPGIEDLTQTPAGEAPEKAAFS